MASLLSRYRLLFTQGFVPIFVGDRLDAMQLAEASVQAGASVIEITCRRANARQEIAVVKKNFPDLIVLAGSVVDDGPLLRHLQRRQPAMPSIDQLIDAGADGFVSALPIRPATIARISATHLVLPGVETLTEIVEVLEAGAHAAKLLTADLTGGPARVARLTSAPTHGLIPLFVTGGITAECIADYLKAGAMLLGSGWDLMLGTDYARQQERAVTSELAQALRRFIDAFQSAQKASAADESDEQFIRRRTHVLPTALFGGE